MLAMDFVSAWKASSIVLTGAFGVLGLLTEFKHKETRKITKWGFISLGGILISTVLGVSAQIKESADDAKKALKVATTSEAMLNDIHRTLLRIDSPTIRISFRSSCKAWIPHNVHDFSQTCKFFKSEGIRLRDKGRWSPFPPKSTRSFYYYIGISRDVVPLGLFSHSLNFSASSGRYHDEQDTLAWYDYTNDTLRIVVIDRNPIVEMNDEKIVSVPDLINAVAELHGTDFEHIGLSPEELDVRMRGGEEVYCSVFESLGGTRDPSEKRCRLLKGPSLVVWPR
jgi:hypothetical protein